MSLEIHNTKNVICSQCKKEYEVCLCCRYYDFEEKFCSKECFEQSKEYKEIEIYLVRQLKEVLNIKNVEMLMTFLYNFSLYEDKRYVMITSNVIHKLMFKE